jgi:hypothetical protein
MKWFLILFIFTGVNFNAVSQNNYLDKDNQKGDLKWMVHAPGHNNYNDFRVKDGEECSADTIEPHILKKFNSNFRVLDSTDYYNGSGMLWNFESRYKTVSFDKFGNIRKGVTNFFNNDTYSWSNKYKIEYTYSDPMNHFRDTYLRQVWDSENSCWLNESYAKYFGTNGGYTELYVKDWNFNRNCFVGGYHYVYTLNSENLASTRLVQKWDTVKNDWTNDMQYSYLYNSSGKTVEIKLEFWNKNLNQWYYSRKDNYEYDASGNNVLQTIQYWTTSLGWFNGYLFENYFDPANFLTTILTKKWNSIKKLWEEIQMNENSYNDIGKLSEVIISKKAGSDLNFIYSQRLGYEYDSKGNQLLYLNQLWDSQSQIWVNSIINTSHYDSKGNHTDFLQQKWDRVMNEWVNDYYEKNSYSRNGLNIQYYKTTWDKILNQWDNQNRRDNYYSGIKGNMGHTGNQTNSCDDNPDKNIGFSIYPNPAKEKFTIRFETDEDINFKRLELSDFYGKLLRSVNINGDGDVTIYRNGLKNGKYWVTLIGKERHSTVVIFE